MILKIVFDAGKDNLKVLTDQYEKNLDNELTSCELSLEKVTSIS